MCSRSCSEFRPWNVAEGAVRNVPGLGQDLEAADVLYEVSWAKWKGEFAILSISRTGAAAMAVNNANPRSPSLPDITQPDCINLFFLERTLCLDDAKISLLSAVAFIVANHKSYVRMHPNHP
jgi:hypothetical protein